jgi:hypothetical protein
MIKTLLVGLWAGGVSLGGAYLAMMMNAEGPDKAESEDGSKVVEFVNTQSMSIPVIRDGKVAGYVVTEMSFAVQKGAEGGEAAAPTPYLIDAAYRTIFENVSADFGHLKPQDLKQLSEQVKKAANARLGEEKVQDVLVSSLNFIARDEIRADWFKKKH